MQEVEPNPVNLAIMPPLEILAQLSQPKLRATSRKTPSRKGTGRAKRLRISIKKSRNHQKKC